MVLKVKTEDLLSYLELKGETLAALFDVQKNENKTEIKDLVAKQSCEDLLKIKSKIQDLDVMFFVRLYLKTYGIDTGIYKFMLFNNPSNRNSIIYLFDINKKYEVNSEDLFKYYQETEEYYKIMHPTYHKMQVFKDVLNFMIRIFASVKVNGPKHMRCQDINAQLIYDLITKDTNFAFDIIEFLKENKIDEGSNAYNDLINDLVYAYNDNRLFDLNILCFKELIKGQHPCK